MKKFRTLIAVLLVIAMFGTLFIGCAKKDKETADNGDTKVTTDSGSDAAATPAATTAPKEKKEFSMFIAMSGTEIPDDNRVMNKLADMYGAWVKMQYLTGQTADERIGVMVAGGEYPDFIVGSTGTAALLEAGALVAIDEYWDKYPNIKNYLTPEQWNMVRAEDGHIYLMPQFGIIKGKDMATYHNDEAFWIQKDVLIWDNFPQIKTMDQYFDLIKRYKEANPKTADGQDTVGFSMSAEDWRYFGIENGPLFLDGYPNDGACIVDPTTKTALDFNTTPTAYTYYKKMNEVYNQGLVYPETYTLTYDQYISLISTGRVLGILDQRWNFQTAEESLVTQGLYGKTYVPLPITIDGQKKDRWHSPSALDVSNGLSITTSCKDVEGALQLVNDLLSPEALKLRYWGEEGTDYVVGSDGVFSRTPEQRANADNQDWATANLCKYDYFPHYEGMLEDGINAADPKSQPKEFYDSLQPVEKQLLDGYGYKTFLDFISHDTPNEPWYPMWSYTNNWTNDTDYGMAKTKMTELKHEWLPKAMMAPAADFDKIWNDYQAAYKSDVDIDAYLGALTTEIQRRASVAEGTAK